MLYNKTIRVYYNKIALKDIFSNIETFYFKENAVDAGIVPILYANIDVNSTNHSRLTPDYNQCFPTNDQHPTFDSSAINLARFSSAKEAASFIEDIGRNQTLYNSYLWYRQLGNQTTATEEIKERMRRRPFYKYDKKVEISTFYPSKELTCQVANQI